MNMRKIIAVLSAVLMLCAIIPMGVFAAPGDIINNKNFDDGSVFSNASAENGYMVFDATTANWANVYLYANAIKSGTKYEISFDAKADKATNINVKINNNWTGDTFKWTTNVTTEWVTYTCVINPDELATLTSTALLMFTSNTTAANGAVYHIDNVVVKEYTDPDTIGKITNGSFEDGTANWNTDSSASLYTADAYEGNNSLKLSNTGYYASAATQTIPVKANTNYELVWYSKRLSGTGAFNIILCQSVSPWTNYTKVAGQNWMNETSGNWVKNSYTINTGDNTSMLIKWTSERSGDAGEILLDAIQLIELKDPSFDGYITNGDFETSKADPWTLHQSTVISADAAHTGDYGAHIVGVGNWGGLLEQNVSNLVVGQKYLFSFWMKMNHQGVNVKIGDNYVGWFNSVGDWTLVTKEFTATATTAKILINGGGDGNANPDLAADVYVDDFSIVELLEPSDDGYIYNGNFESGKKESFVLDQQTAITMAAAKDGNFGAELKGNGGWGGLLGYTFAVEAGATYQLSFDTKVIGKGANVTVLADTWQGAKLQTGWAGSADWSTVTLEFVATTNQCYLNINGSGTGSPEHLYVDNVRVVKIKDAHVCEFVGVETKAPTCGEPGVMTYSCTCGEGTYTEEIPATGEHTYDDEYDADCNVCGGIREVTAPVAFNGNSVSEDVEGLAFLFSVDAKIDIAFERITEIDYTNASFGGYKLNMMGAKLSNGFEEIDIPAVYAWNYTDSSVSYAVRVLELDEDLKKDCTITAKPYIVIEKDGVEITVFGAIQSATYNSVLNG